MFSGTVAEIMSDIDLKPTAESISASSAGEMELWRLAKLHGESTMRVSRNRDAAFGAAADGI